MDKTDTTRLTLNNAYPKSIIGDTPMPLRDQICAKMSSVEDLRAASAISTKASVNTSIADIATESTEPASPAQKSRMLESPSQTQPPVAMDKSGSSVKKAISTTALSMLPARNPPSENARENSRGRSRKENLCATADKLATEMTSEPSNDTNNNSNGFGGPDGSDEEDFAEDDENDDDDMSDEISNLASPGKLYDAIFYYIIFKRTMSFLTSLSISFCVCACVLLVSPFSYFFLSSSTAVVLFTINITSWMWLQKNLLLCKIKNLGWRFLLWSPSHFDI